ncbi:hypothetical protein [Paenibacillus sp. y28]|uniref:hypothetical protein n=1 Tax=Paenibacillus sp. y28 TaxID=3129110 RepID=UPI00301B5F77
MKKRLITMLLVVLCLMTAMMPAAFADDANLYLFGTTEIQSDWLHGRTVTDLYVSNWGVYEVYYAMKDQNDNLLGHGWIQPGNNLQFSNGSITYQSSGATLFWNTWNYNSYANITDIKFEMSCYAACDANGYIEVH